MAENNKEDCVTLEKEGSVFVALVAGPGVGAVGAILFSPRPGKGTRELIVAGLRERKDLLAAPSTKTIFYGRDGRIAGHFFGGQTRTVFEQAIQLILATRSSENRLNRSSFAGQ